MYSPLTIPTWPTAFIYLTLSCVYDSCQLKKNKKKRKKETCYSLLCRVITKFPLNSKIHTITSVIFSLPFVQPAKPISCLALWILMKNWAWNSMLPWERITEAWRTWAWEEWIQIRGLPDLGLWKPDQTLQIISSLACQQYYFGNGYLKLLRTTRSRCCNPSRIESALNQTAGMTEDTVSLLCLRWTDTIGLWSLWNAFTCSVLRTDENLV